MSSPYLAMVVGGNRSLRGCWYGTVQCCISNDLVERGQALFYVHFGSQVRAICRGSSHRENEARNLNRSAGEVMASEMALLEGAMA